MKLTDEQVRAVTMWEAISRGFDGPDSVEPFGRGLCLAAHDMTGPGDCAYSALSPSGQRIAPFLGLAVCPYHPGDRPLRATVAALIAAMIATGDDPAEWTNRWVPEVGEQVRYARYGVGVVRHVGTEHAGVLIAGVFTGRRCDGTEVVEWFPVSMLQPMTQKVEKP